MTPHTVHLTSRMERFIASRVADGGFGSTDEVIQAALESFELAERNDEAKLAILRQAIQDGIDSGEAEGDVFAQVREELGLPADEK